MDIKTPDASHFAERALAHVRVLARGGRGSTTAAERQAGDYVQDQLKSLGVSNIEVQPFYGERSLWLFIALVLGLALVGHAAYWLLRKPAGNLPALVIAVLAFGFSGYLVWGGFTLRVYPLRSTVPRALSHNVIAKIPPPGGTPSGEPQRRLVLVAHLDSHRAVFWFATDFLVRLFVPVSMITIYGVYLAIPVYALAALTHWQGFGWLGLLLAIFYFLGWVSGAHA